MLFAIGIMFFTWRKLSNFSSLVGSGVENVLWHLLERGPCLISLVSTWWDERTWWSDAGLIAVGDGFVGFYDVIFCGAFSDELVEVLNVEWGSFKLVVRNVRKELYLLLFQSVFILTFLKFNPLIFVTFFKFRKRGINTRLFGQDSGACHFGDWSIV